MLKEIFTSISLILVNYISEWGNCIKLFVCDFSKKAVLKYNCFVKLLIL